jgi:hypothetical protein
VAMMSPAEVQRCRLSGMAPLSQDSAALSSIGAAAAVDREGSGVLVLGDGSPRRGGRPYSALHLPEVCSAAEALLSGDS